MLQYPPVLSHCLVPPPLPRTSGSLSIFSRLSQPVPKSPILCSFPMRLLPPRPVFLAIHWPVSITTREIDHGLPLALCSIHADVIVRGRSRYATFFFSALRPTVMNRPVSYANSQHAYPEVDPGQHCKPCPLL